MDQFLSDKNLRKSIDKNLKLIREDETLLLILDMQEKLISSVKGNQMLIFNIKKPVSYTHLTLPTICSV